MISCPCGKYDVGYIERSPVTGTVLQGGLVVLVSVFLFTLPLYLSDIYLTLANQIGISFIAALGLYFLTGCCGIINLGQAAFMCTGAISAVILCLKYDFSPWAALPCAILAGGVAGFIFGLSALRVKGFSLIVATLGAGVIVPELFRTEILPACDLPTTGLTVERLSIAGRTIDSPAEIFFTITLCAILVVLFTIFLSKGRIGRLFRSIRDNELTAAVGGVNVSHYKLLAFFICSFYAGFAGWLWVFWMPGVSSAQFPFTESVWYLAMIVIGGMESIFGILLGTIIVRGLGFLMGEHVVPWLIESAMPGGSLFGVLPSDIANRAGGIFPLILSIMFIVFLITARRGVAWWVEKGKLFYRLWPCFR
jgi:branched-chain amino acid transport system permease protein